MKMTFVTVSSPAIENLIAAEKYIAEQSPGALELKLYYAIPEMEFEKRARMTADIENSDFVFVDLMGAPPVNSAAVTAGLENCGGHIVPYGNAAREYMRLGDFVADTTSETAGRGMSAMRAESSAVPPGMSDRKNYGQILKYFRVADYGNMLDLLLFLLTEYGGETGLPEVQPPHEVESIAYCDPERMSFYDSFESYCETFPFDMEKPVIAMLFYAHIYPTDTSGCVRDIKRRLDALGNVVPVAVSGTLAENSETLRAMLCDMLPKPVDVILNFMSFRLSAGPAGGDAQAGVDLLTEIGAPYLHPFFMSRRSEASWRESVQGCTPSEVMVSVMLPELDGCIDTIPVGAVSEPEYNAEHDIYTEKLMLIEERADRLTGRVGKLLNLRLKPNAEKRVAIICYNYPPGEDNLFGGAFLDTFASVEAIVSTLNKEGYCVPALSKDELMQNFTAGKAVNSGRYGDVWDEMIRFPVKKYEADAEVSEAWGPAPGNIMADGSDFLIPGIVAGNIFIGLQPSRRSDDKDEQAYHDKTLPPHHQYIAFYQWLREEFEADAVIHVGTHGTLEFLKGKECGMSGDCYPDRLIGDMPHIYLYYCGNPSEATIAKRRSNANIVSYQPPVFVPGELYGDYLTLATEIENYRQAQAIAPGGASEILTRAMALAVSLNLSGELDDIEAEIYRLGASLIPKGLHVFGSGYDKDEALAYAEGLSKLKAGENDIAAAIQKAMVNNETQGLLTVLEGRYNPARLAGDIYRSPEVLPAGYNLFQFDPRLIPSATAAQRGQRIAENTLAQHLAEGGSYPHSVAVILWGLETSRTQGETFSQILSYIGARKSADSSPWDAKYEIIPLAELGRPRIDVTVNICGFFRDMFPNLIDDLDDLFTEIAGLDEDLGDNYIKAHSASLYAILVSAGYDEEQAKQLAVSRVFGPREGRYGTGITGIFETKDWETEEKIGQSFIASLRHVYNRRMRGKAVPGLYEDNLRSVEIVSQIRSNHEYEITDLDHYYEFFGGLAKSVELVKGTKARMLISDTTGEQILTENVEKSIARGIRTRALNPKWIDGLLAHKYHGAQKIYDRFENIMGLAATTNSVEQWVYNDLDKQYVEDEELRRRMIENNPYAYMKILEQMMEYSERGYWDASEEQIERIKAIYLEIENDVEGSI